MDDTTQTGNFSEDSGLHIVATTMEVFCIIIISLLTLLLNALNFVLLSQLPTFKNNMGMYLRSLSCAGFITGLIFTLSIYPAIFGYSYFPYHQLICETQAFIIVQASDVSIVTQAMLNLDRYVSIYYHMKYLQFMSIRKCQIINLAIWIISFMFGMPVFISLGATYMKNSYLCSPDLKSNRLYTMSLITLILLPATTIMFFSYIQLLKISRRHATQIEAQISAVSSNKSSNKEPGKRSGGKNMKALKMLLVITFAFNITWLPFTVLSVYRMLSGGETEPHWIGFFIPWWAQVGTLINAVIYFVFSKEYRLGLKKYLKLNTKKDQENMIAERTTAWM
ncbi:tyramine receptor tyra-2-like [Anneissia japonica]|uniref:tyramine receptor tyra-2-like n=1 Tax=Anneissia japonica TaxID=1529436 RepID=UPI0014255FF6|nr:tyramine receptor tyra-2-like [Anneissia japonica]